ncbi:HTH marR-type domain-containing protein [Ruminococcaceae bacterium BL-6]|jgi:DNA-binding MarR family transcriptional regulator|nr:HTH marR-type domain-containing protein [Ruminococcaceae bacterium BL-6]HBC26772.1 hypothetical protein [Oscillospiraceae bacterium]
MNDDPIRKQLNEYYATFKEADALYSAFAKRSGLSDAAFWALYTICGAGEECTQKTIREQWSISKQTVNSAINDLVRDNFIALSECKSDKRSKRITLTEKGVKFTEENIDLIYRLERSAFERMTDEERAALIAGSRRFLELFRLEITPFLK